MNEFYCPLYNLNLDDNIKFTNDELEISTDLNINIVSKEILPDLSTIKDELSIKDLAYIVLNVKYWLRIDTNFNNVEIQIIVNIFQLASWIVKPTELQIWFISNFAKDDLNESNFLKLKKIEYIPKHVEPCFHNEDVTKLKRMFPILLKLYKKSPIFYTAIGLNFQGCVAFHWEAAYVLYTTTFECLLRHKAHICKILQEKLEWGLTKELSWAYAILTETENEKRQEAFDDFRDIYKIRSDIVHGKSNKKEYNKEECNKEDPNLKELAKCRDMLRKLWQVILDSPELIEKLSGNDKMRKDYFKRIANGWMPEVKDEKGK